MRRVNTNILLVLYFLLKGCSCITVTEVTAPATIAEGSYGDMDCQWSLKSHEELYSVKWYQNVSEIYRYTIQKTKRSTKIFPNDYLSVDKKHSSLGRIRIYNVSLDASGLFRCEVSAEAPSFYTAYGAVNVTVVHPPDGGPHIQNDRSDYEPGDWAELKCQTPDSNPAPTISFFINEKKVPEDWARSQIIYPSVNGLFGTYKTLKFQLPIDRHWHFKIRCLATILDIYKGTDEVSLTSNSPHALVYNQATRTHFKDLFACVLLLHIFFGYVQLV